MQHEETFMHFLLEHQYKNKRTLNFIILMESILTAARLIEHQYRLGALHQTLGEAGTINVQGEKVMQMDRMAHEIAVHCLRESSTVISVISEEEEDPIKLNPDGRYFVYIDPLDGSSNVKHSLPVGFLFGIGKKNLNGPEDEHLRSGSDYIAAGMFLIPSGIFTFALKDAGAWRFLMNENGVYVRPTRVQFPTERKSWELSWNAGNRRAFRKEVSNWLQEQDSNYSFRYAGSLVVDFHRLLHNGGMFCYPAVLKPGASKSEGKLRLMYEAAVVAFIAREAGGLAVDEEGREILSVKPDKQHQRTALYVGCKETVEGVREVLKSR